MPLKNLEKEKEYQKKYYLKNREKIIKLNRLYSLKNKEKIKMYNVEYQKKYSLNNKEKIKNKNMLYILKNKDKIKKYHIKYYLKNKDKIKKYTKEYSLKNRHIRRAAWAKRKASELRATPKFANLNKIKEIYKNCPKGYHVDHIVPLISKIVCGLHVEWNLQYLTPSDNCSKSNKLIY